MNVNDANIQDNRQLPNPRQPPKKCHGNRKDQRFRKKCRASGMKPEAIEKLLNQLKQTGKESNRRNEYITKMINENTDATTITSKKALDQPSHHLKRTTTITTTNPNLYKRKRDVSLQELKTSSTIPKSTSSISIVEPLSKKMKNKRRTIMKPILKENKKNINKNYRFVCSCFYRIEYVSDYRRPMYLTRSPFMLFQRLSKRMNYSLKKKDEQQFLYTRLDLLDPHYCMEIDLKLWQSYLDVGLEKRTWPVSFFYGK